MLSNRFYRWLDLLVPKFAHLGGLSYSWDATDQLFFPLHKKSSNRKKILIGYGYMVLWNLYLLLQIIWHASLKKYNLALFIFTMLILLYCEYIMCSIIIIGADDFFSMANSSLLFLRWMNSKTQFNKYFTIILILQDE